MSNTGLDKAVREIYSNEELTKEFADNPLSTLEKLGVSPKAVKVGEPIVPPSEEVGQVCASVCPGIPVINACLGYSVGEDV